ncbi:MAG TPA: thiamine pyrophosphate-binding protein [Casimicrobiaceae bacterium]|nr:thiamine pyrophosphate-binding protein [Casimicrobiaceae bacterium]
MRTRGADALMRVLRERGVSQVFTVSGNHVMSAFDAALDAGVALVHARHEAAAVHMADARSRVSGQVGVALVTGGPGHANAISALYTARMAEAPVVLLSGQAPRSQLGMGAFQEMAQAELALPLTKAAWTCSGPDAIARDVARAIAIACAGRPGPVSLSLPSDALEGDAGSGFDHEAAAAPETLDPAVADAIVERLRKAARPIVIVGPASMTRHGRVGATALEAAIGIPVVGMESPRGIADPSLGAFGEMLAQADCVVLVGKRLDFTLRFAKPPAIAADCTFLQIDADAEEFARTRRAVGDRLALTARAAAAATLQRLAERASARAPSRHAVWQREVEAAIAYRPPEWKGASSKDPHRLHPLEALRPLQALLDSRPDSVFVSDGGEFGQWAQACLHAPHRVINGMAGAIGSALAYAIGARCALPDAPIVATLGDGTFGFHAAEIDTAARYKLPFVAVVGNDARWNAEYQIQLREYGAGRLVGCELAPTRYDAVCAAFGGYGELVTRASDMVGAISHAHASKAPACVNAMIEGVAAPTFARR